MKLAVGITLAIAFAWELAHQKVVAGDGRGFIPIKRFDGDLRTLPR
jgi:hypothetical protein